MEDVKVVKRFLEPRFIGSGDGHGSGHGDGSGDGDGFGSGNGSGDGHGSGSGSGYGDGYGDLKQFCGETVWYIDDVPTLIDQVKGDYAKGRIINKDFTTSPCYVARVDNSFAHGETLKKAVADAQAKALESCPVEEKIKRFITAYPSLDSKDTCANFYNWHHILTGSCTMGRDQFVKENGLDMDKEYTVEYFLRITANAYGREVVNRLREAYEGFWEARCWGCTI